VRERVARRTDASVLVVPEGTVERPNCVLAAIDEGVFGRAVLAAAAAIASLHRIPLVVLHVLAPVSGAYERVIEHWRRSRRPSLPSLGEAIGSAVSLSAPGWLRDISGSRDPLPVERVEIEVGDPAREIVRTARTLGAPLVVVGKRGADGAPAGSLGSVARLVLASCPMPVLAVGGN
jgi:hypothetical protein